MRLMAKWALFKVLKEFGGGGRRKERKKERKKRTVAVSDLYVCMLLSVYTQIYNFN